MYVFCTLLRKHCYSNCSGVVYSSLECSVQPSVLILYMYSGKPFIVVESGLVKVDTVYQHSMGQEAK